MATTTEAIETEALNLPTADRARLVEKLIASLDTDPEVETAWISEIARREAAIESGEAAWLAGPATLAKLRSELQSPID